MKYTMKNISLFTCSVIASIVVLSACAQTTVTVRPTQDAKETVTAKPVASAQKNYEPISREVPYAVQAGDTLYGISFRAGLSYREVAAWNNISEPYTVKIGQRLVLRPINNGPPADVVVAHATPATTVAVAKPEETKPVEGKPVIVKPPIVSTPAIVAATVTDTASPIPVPISKPTAPAPVVTSIEKPVSIVTPEIKPGSAMSWRWPSEGTVIARYVQGDTTQQGINIGGKSGQPVHASGDGTVVYSGAGLVGYGELIIIKHSNEWLSAYAHNRRRLVAEGTKVKAGDVIAEMGRTGTMRDMLHFEIRRNGKPVDPLLYLPKQ